MNSRRERYPKARVWMKRIVVFEPQRQRFDDGLSIGLRIDVDVVSFEGFDESLGHSV